MGQGIWNLDRNYQPKAGLQPPDGSNGSADATYANQTAQQNGQTSPFTKTAAPAQPNYYSPQQTSATGMVTPTGGVPLPQPAQPVVDRSNVASGNRGSGQPTSSPQGSSTIQPVVIRNPDGSIQSGPGIPINTAPSINGGNIMPPPPSGYTYNQPPPGNITGPPGSLYTNPSTSPVTYFGGPNGAYPTNPNAPPMLPPVYGATQTGPANPGNGTAQPATSGMDQSTFANWLSGYYQSKGRTLDAQGLATWWGYYQQFGNADPTYFQQRLDQGLFQDAGGQGGGIGTGVANGVGIGGGAPQLGGARPFIGSAPTLTANLIQGGVPTLGNGSQYQNPALMGQQDKLMGQILGQPTLSPEVIAQMQEQQKELAVNQGQAAGRQYDQNAAGRGIFGGGTYESNKQNQANQLTQQLLQSNRDVNVNAATTNRQSLLDALSASQSVLGQRQNLGYNYDAANANLGFNYNNANANIMNQTALNNANLGYQYGLGNANLGLQYDTQNATLQQQFINSLLGL